MLLSHLDVNVLTCRTGASVRPQWRRRARSDVSPSQHVPTTRIEWWCEKIIVIITDLFNNGYHNSNESIFISLPCVPLAERRWCRVVVWRRPDTCWHTTHTTTQITNVILSNSLKLNNWKNEVYRLQCISGALWNKN